MTTFKHILNTIKSQVKECFNSSDLFINRESSWLLFNSRVLHQTTKPTIPLMERLKFLAISSSNLDEFIMVRLASIINRLGTTHTDITGMDPDEEYDVIVESIIRFRNNQEHVFHSLCESLKRENIYFSKINELTEDEKEQVKDIFKSEIYPVLTPITCDSTKEFPLLKSKKLTIIVEIEDNINPNLNVLSVIPIPNGLPRVFKLQSMENGKPVIKFVFIEDIIKDNLHRIFINKKIISCGLLKLLRKADIELDSDTDIYLIDRVKQNLLLREFSEPIFIETKGIPKHALKILNKMLGLSGVVNYKTKSIIDYSFLMNLPEVNKKYLYYEDFTPQYPEELIGEWDMFSAIDNDDVLLHHPYESYDPIIKFLEHASNDKDVLAIKQTLYRVSSKESPIINALCHAAENGKNVSVLLELKARFDEGQNLNLIEKLKVSGCHITFGIEELKTHCKFISVIRKTKKGLRVYSHIGTGNYNDKTAKIYTDISLFTSNQKIGEDLISLFNMLSGFSDVNGVQPKVISYSPYNIRTTLHKLIDKEIKKAELSGEPGHIIIKVNSISDRDIIQKLYYASNNNVKVHIICRGICSMKPINDNIIIESIVGRFLEHSRMFYFANNGKPKVYISSADLLTRNLDKRVELMVPIKSKAAKNKILEIIGVYLRPSNQKYRMQPTGIYQINHDAPQMFCQDLFMKHAITKYKYRNITKDIKYKKR